MRSRLQSSVINTLYYGTLVAVLAAIMLELLPQLLPAALAGRISRNSEGLLLALLVSLWIQFARPGLRGRRAGWPLTALAASACVAAGALLLASDLASRFRTLNETLLAAALLLPWLYARRPLPRAVAAGVPLVLLAAVVLANRTTVITELAETLAALMLFPIALDLVDKGILDPTAATSRALRLFWYGFLVATPVVCSLLEYRLGVSGALGEAVRYLVRITEAFLCLLIIEAWFAVVLGRTGRLRPRSGGAVEKPVNAVAGAS